MNLNKRITIKGAVFMIMIIKFAFFVNAQKYLQDPKYGQDEEARNECASNLSIMKEYVEINMFDYAYDAWKYCYINCPGANKSIYIRGAKILKHKIENAENEETVNPYLDTLMQLYDQRIEYFDQEGYVLGWKGIDWLRYRPDEVKTGYDFLKKSIEISGAKSEEAVCVAFTQASNVLYKNNSHSASDFISDYVQVSDLLNEKINMLSSSNKKLSDVEETKAALGNVEKMFAESGAADCEALLSIFTPKFKESPNDVELLKKITYLLDKTNCKESGLFAESSEALYKLESSAKAAYNLGSLFEVRKELDKAMDYYSKAAEQETNKDDKALYYYKKALVAYKQKNYISARNNALEAIKFKPDFGDAYILIGTAYAASSQSFSSEEFNKATVYWVAVDKFIKAKNVDPSVADMANDLVRQYSALFPTKEEIFFRSLTEGTDFTVEGWINETTKVRARKN